MTSERPSVTKSGESAAPSGASASTWSWRSWRARTVDLDDLPITASTADAMRAWVATYSDEKLPSVGSGDPDWISEGIGLLHRCRQELGAGYEVVVTEPWWGEPTTD